LVSRNASSVTERFGRHRGRLTALPAAQVDGRDAEHEGRVQQADRGSIRLLTLKNRSAVIGSDSHAVSAQSAHRF
jgi:hypothetical protein